MERRNALLRLTVSWCFFGALLGGGLALLAGSTFNRIPGVTTMIPMGIGLGAFLGLCVGAIIADAKYPP